MGNASVYQVDADHLTKEDREKLQEELMLNQDEKRELHVCMESIRKNVEFINRFQKKLQNLMSEEGKVLQRAMNSYFEQAKDNEKEQDRIMGRLKMKKIKSVNSEELTVTT